MKKFLRVLAVAMLLLAIAIPCLAETTKCEHEFVVNTESSKAPTCTEKGYTVYSCKKCHAESANYTVEIPANGHKWGNVEDVTEPNCYKAGTGIRKCTVNGCSATDEVKIPATGKHTSRPVTKDDKRVDVAATCSKEGYKITEICSVCGITTKTEKIAKDPDAHHQTGVWVELTPATCTENKVQVIRCKDCDKILHTMTVANSALDHDWAGWVIDVPATCEKDGTTSNTCKRCGLKSEGAKDPARGHDVLVTVVDPTCTKDGSIVETCKTCKKVLKTSVLKATGHDEKNATWKVVTEATTCANGKMDKVCPVCKAVLDTKVIAATGTGEHEASGWIIVRQPNAYQEGKAVKTCNLCGVQLAKKYFTNAASLGNNVKVDTSKKDTTSTTTSSKNNTTTSTSKNNTASTSSNKDTKAVVTVEPVVVKEWKLGEKFEIADGVFMTITLNAETNKYDVVVEGVDNIETAKIAFVAADATEAPADEDYTDLIASNWVIDTVDEAAILYIVID